MLETSRRLAKLTGDQLGKVRRWIALHVPLKAVPFILVAITILAGIIGGVQQSFDGSFASFAIIVFKSLGNLTPNYKNLSADNEFLEAAAFFGIVNIYLSGLLLVAKVLRESRRKFVARWFLRNHVVVIGNTPLAVRAVALWTKRERRVVHVIPATSETAPEWTSRAIRLPLDVSLEKAVSLSRARHVFFDLEDDLATLGLAFDLAAKVAKNDQARAGAVPGEWVVTARDVPLADHFVSKLTDLRMDAASEPMLPAVHFLDPERLMARHQLACHPPFLIADRFGQGKIHLLIVGFDAAGQQLLETSLLSSGTAELGVASFTVLSSDPIQKRQAFLAGRPPLSDMVDIAFLELHALHDYLDGGSSDAKALQARDNAIPLTAVFLTCQPLRENVHYGLTIDTIRRRKGRLTCPIFALEENLLNAGFLAGSGSLDTMLDDFSIFGFSDRSLELQLCFSETRDGLAKALHDRYSNVPRGTPSIAWDRLPESLRRANRNAADHWRAKMHMLGFRVDDVPPGTVPTIADADARALLEHFESLFLPTPHEPLWNAVQAEHERWVLERTLEGWRYGDVKDELKQEHPLLIDWAALLERHPDETAKGADQIKALVAFLAKSGDRQFVLQRRTAAESRAG